jgi:putative copper resistance protein D
MHTLYLLSVYLHILSAVIWIGGMAFLVLVVVPWLRVGGQRVAGVFLRETGQRFSRVAWICFGVSLVTGSFNLWVRGVRFATLADPGWLATPFAKAVVSKLALFIAVLITSTIHDFVVGPRAAQAILADPTSAETARLRRQATRLGRLNALFALILVGLAVAIVRGAP